VRNEVLARAARISIWLISFVAAGATKPLFFPQGGLRYFLVAVSVIVVGAFVGKWVESQILKA
jgi:hypothetical protein